MSVLLQYLKSALNTNWALKSGKRIPPRKRHLNFLGHETRSREEVLHKLWLLDIFKYPINAERAGNAKADSLNRSSALTGGQVLITLWMPGASFHITNLLVVDNCLSSVHIISCCLCKTGKRIELSSGCFYCSFSPNTVVLSMKLCCGTEFLEKEQSPFALDAAQTPTACSKELTI